MKSAYKTILSFLLLIFLFILIKTAWIADDAFLTIRSVDNFVNGYGLRWNILERVQIYTHPFWMFLLSGVYYIFRNPLITFYICSISTSLVVIYLFGINFTTTYAKIILGYTIIFFSKSFIDYSSSGLENPLTHLLTILFLILFFQEKEFSLHQVFILFLIASLQAFNRMDTILLFIPSLLYILYRKWNLRALIISGFGFTPFLLWEFFSLLYYGFPFPNTAYAKLATGIDKTLLIQQGFRYFLDSLLRDPITLFVIFTAILFTFLGKRTKDSLIATGIVIYLVYVIQIGGDFMSGRYFSAPLLIAVILLVRNQFFFTNLLKLQFYLFFLLLVFLQVFSLSPYSLGSKSKNGINDEKSAYFSATALTNLDLETLQPNNLWVRQGLEHKAKDRKLSIGPSSGMFAFYSGPDLHIVETHGLGDPLLARLPSIEQNRVQIGHFYRAVPAGYWKFNRSFGNQIEDENLRMYYEKLSILIHDRILISPNRLVTIWRMNTGYYDYLLDSYVESINSPQK